MGGHEWRRRYAVGAAVVVAVGVLLGATLLPSGCTAPPARSSTEASPTAGAPAGGVNSATPLNPTGSGEATSAFESAAAHVSEVVVNVSISQDFSTSHGNQAVTTGNGSGIVIRQDGLILTNDHVVNGASRLLVGLGMRQMPATIVGEDPSTDLAVIKIAATGLVAAQPGASRALRRGQWVIAVGSPYGLERTVTSGIISALNRATVDPSGATPAAYTNLIQTDAAINPGNSGGALATLDGKIVGVNSLTESPNGASAGVGLAIPFDFAMSIANQLIETGHAIHPYIGVGVIDLDQHVAQTLGVRGVTQGVLIQNIAATSPARSAGLKVGDVITSVGGQVVIDSATFFAALRAQAIGKIASVAIVRSGKPQTIQVVIGAGKNG